MYSGKAQGKQDSSQGSESDIELPSASNRSPDHLRPSASTSLPPITPQASASIAQLRGNHKSGSIAARCFQFFIRNWTRFLLLIILIVLIILVSVKGLTVFGDILRFFQQQNNWLGWLYFTLLYCVNVALFLPGIVLILGAGFIFGLPKGFLAVWIGGGVGQALAFLLARYLVQDSVSVLVKGKWKKWEIIDKAIEQEGWKLLVLLRLSPIVPYNLLNITMAATKIHFWPFALASLFGIIPECALVCYLGSLATDITQVISGEAGPKGALTYILAGITLLIIIGSATWATLFVRQAMRRAEANLRLDDVENGEFAEAGNDLYSEENVLAPHHLQEDYVAQYPDDMPRSLNSLPDPHPRRPFSLLRTAALVAIPGLGSPGSTKILMTEALGGSIWDGSGNRAAEPRSPEGAHNQDAWQGGEDSLEESLLQSGSEAASKRHGS